MSRMTSNPASYIVTAGDLLRCVYPVVQGVFFADHGRAVPAVQQLLRLFYLVVRGPLLYIMLI